MQRFTCECGNSLFFGSTRCLSCGKEVGFDLCSGTMIKIAPSGKFRRCQNGVFHGVCNWTVAEGSRDKLCLACTMNQVIPDLNDTRNKLLWERTETAKRRLLYTLHRLGIKIPSKKEDPQNGLAFEIVSIVLNPSVTTGHLNGVITVNLEEADDTYRQINRQQLGENSRTLLGHFRHESAHYFWRRFLSDLEWGDPQRMAFRERFGNESKDYAASLESHYRLGAPLEWEQQFISAYAASHPWEDWAETWAHYLQMVDGLETCEAMGIHVQNLTLPLMILPVQSGFLPTCLVPPPGEDDTFLAMLQRWLCLSTVLNEVSDSLGESPLYPFVISVPIAQKLRLAHYFAGKWGTEKRGV